MRRDMDLSSSALVLDQGNLISITGPLIAGLVALVVLYTLFHSKRNDVLCSWPPSPPRLPILGHLHLVGEMVHLDMHALSQKYGPLIHLQMGSTHSLVVSSAEMAKLVLKTHDRVFASRPTTGAVLEIFSHNYQDLACAPYGPHWRHMRKLCNTELFSVKRIQSFAYLRNEEMASFVKSIRDESASGQAVTLPEKLTHMMLNIMTRMTMGRRLISWDLEHVEDEADLHKFKETITEMFALCGVANNLGDYFPSIRWMDLQGYERRMRKTSREFDDFILNMIEQKRSQRDSASDDKKDILDILLSLPSDEVNVRLSDDVALSTVQNILSAGVDTSSSTVEWALAEMLRKPSTMEKVQAELDSVVGRSRIVEESDVPNLPYLGCVVKETFRLHPAAPLLIPHESSEPCRLLKYDIPAKTRLYVNAWAIGRDPAEWVNPNEFNPERFIGSDVDVQGQHFGILPFGSGRRQCPGMSMGLTVVSYTIARILHSFDLRLPPPMKPEDVNMREKFGLTMIKSDPVIVMASQRLPKELYE